MVYVGIVAAVLLYVCHVVACVVLHKQRKAAIANSAANAEHVADLREQVTVDAERIAELEALRDAYAEQVADLNEQVERLTQRIDAYENDGDDSYDEDCYDASYEGCYDE